MDTALALSTPIDRRTFVSGVPAERVLEIGPFNSPTFKGTGVQYFDVLTANEIHAETVKLGRPTDNVPNLIHYVARDVALGQIPEKFSAVYSSHCIEHTLDAIGHVNDVASLLDNDGKYFLVIPDKRYCFDHFKPLTTIGSLIEAHKTKPQDYSLRLWVDRAAMSTHGDVRRHWSGDHGDLPTGNVLIEKLKTAIKEYNSGYRFKMGPHIWCFTPDTFFQMFETLYGLGVSTLRPIDVRPTRRDSLEFYAVLGQ